MTEGRLQEPEERPRTLRDPYVSVAEGPRQVRATCEAGSGTSTVTSRRYRTAETSGALSDSRRSWTNAPSLTVVRSGQRPTGCGRGRFLAHNPKVEVQVLPAQPRTFHRGIGAPLRFCDFVFCRDGAEARGEGHRGINVDERGCHLESLILQARPASAAPRENPRHAGVISSPSSFRLSGSQAFGWTFWPKLLACTQNSNFDLDLDFGFELRARGISAKSMPEV